MTTELESLVAIMAEASKRAARLEEELRQLSASRDLRPDQRHKTEAARAKARGLAGPASVATPRAVERARFFSKAGLPENADWYELLLPPLGQVVKVPEGCLITGGDRSWRREESW